MNSNVYSLTTRQNRSLSFPSFNELLYIACSLCIIGWFKSLDLTLLVLLLGFVFFLSDFQSAPGVVRSSESKLIFSEVLCAIVLEVITSIGSKSYSVFQITHWNVARILIFFLMVSTVLSVVRNRSSRSLASYQNTDGIIRSRIRSFKAFSIVLIACLIMACLFSFLFSLLLHLSLAVVFAIVLPLAFIPPCIYMIVKSDNLYTELFTLFSIMFIGISIICLFPVTNLFSWDDQIHYQNANELSFVCGGESTSSDRMLYDLFRRDLGFSNDASLSKWPIVSGSKWDRGQVAGFSQESNANDTMQSLEVLPTSHIILGYTELGYLPSSLGLWLARALHVPFTFKFIIGKLFNLVFYTLVCAFAVHICPVKKYVLTVLSILPSSLFMAANYSYDPWIISLTMLGVSLFVRLYLNVDSFNFFSFSRCILVFVLAFAPKAIYFPLMLMFVPLLKIRNLSKEERRKYIFVLVAFMLFVIFSFILPFVASNGGGSGDSRGGDGVNSTQQTLFVLRNIPLAFFIISRFVFGEFLAPKFVVSTAGNIAYLGDLADVAPFIPALFFILFLLFIVLDFDQNSKKLRSAVMVSTSLILFLMICYLISAALYVSFTPVGASTVRGVQARYLNPLLVIASVFTFNFGVQLQRPVLFKTKQVLLLVEYGVVYCIFFLLLFVRFLS